MDSEWIARKYRPGDEAGIVRLRRLVFGDRDEQRNTERYWRWEFRDNPVGHGGIWLAVVADEIVGQYAVIPVRMQYCGDVIMASLSLDTMTHPDYRRQAVFTTLASKLYEELGGEDIAITYGFPNRYSVEGLVSKLDWVYVCSLPVFVEPLRVSRIVQTFFANGRLAFPVKGVFTLLASLLFKTREDRPEERARIRWIDRFDDRIDVFWEQVAPKYHIAVVRDSTYLNWRYFDNPGREYRALIAEREEEVEGYVILRCMEQFGLRGGMIVDLGALPGREVVLNALLAEAKRFFREQRMDLIACLLSGEDEYLGVLRKRGFQRLPRRAWFKEWYFEYRLNTPTLDNEFLSDPSNWFLTFGDTDII
jgi:hypothetical protein